MNISQYEFRDNTTFFYWKKDCEFRYISCNDACSDLFGIHPQDIAGLKNEDLKSSTSFRNEEFECFIKQDSLVFQGESLLALNVNRYADKLCALLSYKTPMFNKMKHITGFQARGYLLDISSLREINYFMCFRKTRVFKPTIQNIKHYFGKQFNNIKYITQKELQVLYYIARSYSAREISDIIYRSRRTVEDYSEKLKNKLNCSSKKELVGFAIDSGLVHVDPNVCINGYFLETGS